MKVAIVHDYLIDYGGAERVLGEISEIYPSAPIHVLMLDKKKLGSFWENFEKRKIKTSWFGYIPFSSKLISPLRFLLPLIWGSVDLSEYDLIIDSSSWAITRGFKSKESQVEICYCHTPPRYLYGYDTSRNWKGKWFGGLVKLYALFVNHALRMYDFDRAQKVDYFIANSVNVQGRIEKFYRRPSVVIYPPVELKTLPKPPAKEDFYLTGGRLVAAKNFDLIIKACKSSGVKLKVFGSGILEDSLKSIAGDDVEFLGKLTDQGLAEYYAKAKAFIVAQRDEDFGMTTVEAQAAGTPVIAYKGGGYLESVVDGRTGLFFNELTVESLVKTIKKFEEMKISPTDCVRQANKFSKENFRKKFRNFVKEKYAGTTRG